jgi:hypothetical protein
MSNKELLGLGTIVIFTTAYSNGELVKKGRIVNVVQRDGIYYTIKEEQSNILFEVEESRVEKCKQCC